MAKANQLPSMNLSLMWVWLSQFLSIIGLIGIIDDLKSWQHFLSKFYGFIWPSLEHFLKSFGALVHRLIDLWRMTLRPVYEFLFGWLHLNIPSLWIDIFIVTLFIALGTARYLYLKSQADKYDDELIRNWPAVFVMFASAVIFPPGLFLLGIKDKQRERRKRLMEIAYIYMRNTTIVFALITLTFLILDTFFYRS